ncbi:hypothetical protein J3B02_001054 [Coemansia erecta]|nr:hypothetical protein J3B02_001054 [Coemansia erecta]KAJ2883315.1 hypothetical protein FB639_002201 [Coemansia asiatica]
MANIAATFTSGLVLGSGAVYAFTACFTERSQLMNHKLHRASLSLKEAATGKRQNLPVLTVETPDIMNKYQKFASHISKKALPLAKTEWNSKIEAAGNWVSSIDIDASELASLFYRNRN